MPAPTAATLKLSRELELQRIVTEAQAAALRGVSTDTIRRQVERGELTRIQLSPRRHGFRLGDVLALRPDSDA
jgi:hypothetical protein